MLRKNRKRRIDTDVENRADQDFLLFRQIHSRSRLDVRSLDPNGGE